MVEVVQKPTMTLLISRMMTQTRTMTAILMRVESQMRSTAMSQEDQEMIEIIIRREFYTFMTVISLYRRLASIFQVRTNLYGYLRLKFLL